MANVVEIIVKAVDQASGNIAKATTGLDKFKAGFQSLTGMSLTAAGGIAAAGTAITAITKYTKQAISETSNYISSVTDMARVLGLTTEETSRLIQASDDLFLSQEKLQAGILAASRQGIDVSIEGLKKLADQYVKLEPGLDRAQFLMKTFGRSGADMGKLMEVGSSGIDKAMNAISGGLVVTDEAAKKNIEYKQSLDGLNDSWASLKMTVGTGSLPQVTNFFNLLNNIAGGELVLKSAIEYLYDTGWVKNLSKTLDAANPTLFVTKRATDAYTASLQAQADAYYKLHPELRETQSDLETIYDAWLEDAKGAIEYQKAIEDAALSSTKAKTEWTQAWTSIAEGPDQTAERGAKTFDLLGEKLDELGQYGADVWNGLLEATGQISPEAIRQFAVVQAEIEKIKYWSAKGIPVDVIVNWVTNDPAMQGVLPGTGAIGSGSDWTRKGTKGGPGTPSAWQDSFGNWYFGENPPGLGGSLGDTFPVTPGTQLGATETAGLGATVISVDTTQADANLSHVNALMNQITDKTVTLQVDVNWGNGSIGAAENAVHIDLNGNGIIGRASGGPVWGNRPYLVGEQGPEVIVPSGNGNVIPNKNLGGNVVNFYGDTYFDLKNEQLAENILRNMPVRI